MMPLKLFANRTFSGANLLTFFLYAGLSAGILFLSLNMIQLQGYSQLQAGLTFLPLTILMMSISRFSGSLADKYGPRWLLILGPLVAGIGLLFLSFVKQTARPSEYWTTFFPGIVVLGVGMSITVAPLTATVMGSLPNHYSGTASGINNAMTRIAGVFANAILGTLAILFFSGFLSEKMKDIPLSPESTTAVIAQAANLGNAKLPAGIKEGDRENIAGAFKAGFIIAYANVMRICSGLAFLSACMTFLFINGQPVKNRDV
jgi:MFS family permease